MRLVISSGTGRSAYERVSRLLVMVRKASMAEIVN
jgi:hypothetical protein